MAFEPVIRGRSRPSRVSTGQHGLAQVRASQCKSVQIGTSSYQVAQVGFFPGADLSNRDPAYRPAATSSASASTVASTAAFAFTSAADSIGETIAA